jgi:peptidoglycan hydrolase-like protein with peptidoglycan-binding domain
MIDNKQLASEVQGKLIALGLLDPPVDGTFGKQSTAALKAFQKEFKIDEPECGEQTLKALDEASGVEIYTERDFASRIIKYMKAQGWFISVGQGRYNIVYVEGANADGFPNSDAMNQWNDRRLVIEVTYKTPRIIGTWAATTEPGRFYTLNPMAPGGAFRIAFGQYKAWQVGWHKDHEALVQVQPVPGHRDLNKDGIRTGDKVTEGLYGINQHWGYDLPEVGRASAGCLVGQSKQGHRDFMALIKKDVRYQVDSKYTFMSTIIPGDKLP